MQSQKHALSIRTNSHVPWLIACFAIVSSIANLVTGIIVLASFETGGDIALGVLTIVFAIWGFFGSVLALIYIIKQNRYNRSQATFIAQVSHELRTPLTSIRMFADTLALKRYRSEEDAARMFDQMSAELRRLERLTEQILSAKQQREAKYTLPVELAPILMDVVQSFSAHPEHSRRINLCIEEPIDEVNCSEEDFRTVVSNLIQNALIHGGEGQIDVKLCSQNQRTELFVRDHGRGIAPDMLTKIFEPFERGHSTTDSGIPGFGLGLSIVRDFAKQYAASIRADNPADGGARFILSMPSSRALP